MTTHRISVTVGDDSIKVDPDTLVMTSRDEVHWAATNGRAFSIVFAGGSPFGDTELNHSAATTRQRPRQRGRFKYSVVSVDRPGLRLDPVIIVEEPPSSPNP